MAWPRKFPRGGVRLKGGRKGTRDRDQPYAPHKTPRPKLEVQISEGITALRARQPQGHLGLYVPDTVGQLVQAGVPKKAAHILVRRAAGAFYPETAPRGAGAKTFAEALALQHRAGLVLKYTADGPVLELGGTRYGELLFIDTETEDRLRRIWRRGETERAHDEWARALRQQKGSISDADERAWVRYVLLQIDRRARNLGGKTKTFTLHFRNRKEPIEVTLSTAQHSESTSEASFDTRVRYKTLENVSLGELPRLLARLAQRKTRSGRQLQPLTPSENQMALALENGRRTHSLRAKYRRLYGPNWSSKAKIYAKYLEEKKRRGSKIKGKKRKSRKSSGRSVRASVRKASSKKSRSSKKARRSSRRSGSNLAAKAMRLFHSGKAKSLKSAWKMVKMGRGGRARRNTDHTYVREALVPVKKNRRRKSRRNHGISKPGALWLDYWHPAYEQAVGQFGVEEAWSAGMQPIARRNAKRRKSRRRRR